MTHGEGATAPLLQRRGERAWTGMAERGSVRALRFIRWFYRTLGRHATMVFLALVVVYFFVTGRTTRRVSMDYLTTLWGTPGGRAALRTRPTLRHVFRHLHEFAVQMLDRMVVWSGETELIEIDYRGTEILLD